MGRLPLASSARSVAAAFAAASSSSRPVTRTMRRSKSSSVMTPRVSDARAGEKLRLLPNAARIAGALEVLSKSRWPVVTRRRISLRRVAPLRRYADGPRLGVATTGRSSSTPRWSACASTASMVFTSWRAASTLSSTATRAPGPRVSLTKSMLSACSSGRSYGWSYETLASRTSNHSGPLFPRPWIFTCCAIIVHIVRAPDVRSAQGPVGEGEELLPAVDGLILPVGGAIVVEEAVAGAVVAMELVLLAVLLQLGLVLVDLLRRR